MKDAARALALAEDHAVFDGYPEAGVEGLRSRSSNPVLRLPAEARDYPDAVSGALTALRLAGVDGPYALLLGADAYTAVSETSDHGYPIAAHLARILDGKPIWAPAVNGAFVLSTRGGDFALRLGQDVAIGYTAHDAHGIELYLQETLTFLTYTDEAVVVLEAPGHALSSGRPPCGPRPPRAHEQPPPCGTGPRPTGARRTPTASRRFPDNSLTPAGKCGRGPSGRVPRAVLEGAPVMSSRRLPSLAARILGAVLVLSAVPAPRPRPPGPRDPPPRRPSGRTR